MDFVINLTQLPFLFAIIGLLIIVLFANCIYMNMQLAGLKRRYESLMFGVEGKNLEEMLLTKLQDLSTAKKDIAVLNEKSADISTKLMKCVQRVGVVRFNAFDDMGSDLSFAIALLDDKNNGVVISSIYGRNEARCYAKPVLNSTSKYSLSDEEKKAILDSKNF